MRNDTYEDGMSLPTYNAMVGDGGDTDTPLPDPPVWD